MVKKRLGLIAFSNNSGLGNQTRRLAQMLKPDRILVIDSSPFSQNNTQHFEWYKDFNFFTCMGFPKNHEILKFIEGLDTVFTVENPYNFYLIHACNERGIKTICQTNYEFCENLEKPYLPYPTLFLMPSKWKLRAMREKYNVKYMPPPIFPDEFSKARNINKNRRLKKGGERHFLHVVGTLAHGDRNGTLDLLKAVEKSKSNFKLTIKTQHPLPIDYFLDDPRVEYNLEDVEDPNDLYAGYDALFLPRRYGGLSLTCNEALMSSLPVIMTDLVPNRFLPKEWLVKATKTGTFQARTEINIYSSDIDQLASKFDMDFKSTNVDGKSTDPFKIAQQFTPNKLLNKYLDIL